MDFFQSQDNARKMTGRLVVLFALAVLSLIVLTNLLVMFAFGYINSEVVVGESRTLSFDWNTFLLIGAGVIVIVGAASLYKMASLGSGGEAVAEMLGGRLIVDSSGDLNKQKVLNVVEEMAIASGTPVPPVYLLEDEEGINAFAAGLTPADAVIGVTRGCIDNLSREQLQGVIAHEFSHILNGDMRMNIRLIGLLHGILIIGLIGYFILRSGAGYGAHRVRRSSKDSNGGAILLLGLGLVVIGYAGTFFGNLIKAAVSRQREFLADASAVQFTRNPRGIAGALKRIGGSAYGSRIDNPAGSEVSHLLFGEGMRSLFATHPPLEKRIRRIEPDWDGQFDSSPPPAEEPAEAESATTVRPGPEAVAAAVITGSVLADGMNMNDRFGQVDAGLLASLQDRLKAIPATLQEAVHEPHGARGVIYLLLLSETDPAIRDQQLAFLKTASDDGVYQRLGQLIESVEAIRHGYRLILLDMCMPALRQLSPQQYQLFRDNVSHLIRIDRKVSLFEWSLQKILFHNLDSNFIKPRTSRARYHSYRRLTDEINLLLSALIHAGKQTGITPQQVIELAQASLPEVPLQLLEKKAIRLDRLDEALEKLRDLRPLLKPQLLKACAACITADQQYTATEAEFFRAIADTLDCPMPPIRLEVAEEDATF